MMEKEKLKRIFEFLEEKGEHIAPFMWKLKNDIPLTKEELNIEGDLNLAKSNIESLPEGLEVKGSLRLGYTNIASLPKGLKVRDNLVLAFSSIQTLPEGLKVGGNLFIEYTPLSENYTNYEIREMIKPGFIKGEIVR